MRVAPLADRAMTAEIYQHPAFPPPDDPHAVLWRYLDIDKFTWLVTERRLFMPAAERLGDPFEGTTPQGELDWWRDLAMKADSDEQRKIIEANRLKLCEFARGFKGHYYVSCWHRNQHENDAMWKAYTRGPCSVAIRTTFAVLRASLPSYVDIGMVRYLDYTTGRLPTLNMFEYITHKRIQLSFEQEVRAVALGLLPDQLGGAELRTHLLEKEGDPAFRVYAPPIDLAGLIQGVVFHPQAAPEFIAEVTALCNGHSLPSPAHSEMNREPVF
jgi:hypothetical protein